MKKETKELLNELEIMMKDNGLKGYTIEILLYKKEDDTVAAYTARQENDSYDEKPIYIGYLQDVKKISLDNQYTWLASLLELDFEIVYCSLAFHCLLWSVYYEHYESIAIYKNGLNEYLRYCKQQHITPDLLKAYCGREFDDVVDLEFEETIDQYSVIDRFTINEQAFLFAVDEANGTFGVYESDSDYSCYENERIHTSYLEAFNDFQERIKKCWYDKMRAFNEEYFFTYGGAEEVNSIMNGRNKSS